MVDKTQIQSINRLPGETETAYAHFLYYLALPRDRRSVLSAYRQYLKTEMPEKLAQLENSNPRGLIAAPSAWYEQAKQYHWPDRAKEADAKQADQFKRDIEQSWSDMRHHYVSMLRDVADKLHHAILNANDDDIPLATALQVLPRYSQTIREHTQSPPEALAALQALPADLRTQIIVAIKADTFNLSCENQPDHPKLLDEPDKLDITNIVRS